MPDAVIRLGVDSGAHLDGTLTTASSKLKRWAGKIAPQLGRALGHAFSSLGDVAGFGGIAGLTLAAKQVFDFEKRLVRLRIASRSSARDMLALRDQIHGIATARGVSAGELLGGVEKFVEATGDIASARDALDGFALVAQATGADVSDISAAAAALSINMKISGKEMERALSILAVQGKAGAVELKNFAGILPELTPQFSQFGKKGVDALVEMGSMAQVMRSGFSSAAETATGFQGLMTALVKNAGKLKKIGVKVFDTGPGGKKELRDFSDIVFDLIAKSKGDPQVLQRVLGRAEAVRALLPIMNADRDGLVKFTDNGQSMTEMLADAGIMADSAAGRMAKLKASLELGFSRAMSGNLDKFASMMERIVAAVRWLIEHPATAAMGWLALKMPGGLPGLLGGIAGGGKGKGGALGAAAAGVGVTKVFVVNMPAGLGGGADVPGVPGAPGAKDAAKRAARRAGAAKVGAGLLAGVLGTWDAITEGKDIGGGDIAGSMLGGLLSGGPVGALVAGAVSGGGWLGAKMQPQAMSGGSGSHAAFMKYGAFSEEQTLARERPGMTLDAAREAARMESLTDSPGAGRPLQSALGQSARVREIVDQALAPLEAAVMAKAVAEGIKSARSAFNGIQIRITNAKAFNEVVQAILDMPDRRGG